MPHTITQRTEPLNGGLYMHTASLTVPHEPPTHFTDPVRDLSRQTADAALRYPVIEMQATPDGYLVMAWVESRTPEPTPSETAALVGTLREIEVATRIAL